MRSATRWPSRRQCSRSPDRGPAGKAATPSRFARLCVHAAGPGPCSKNVKERTAGLPGSVSDCMYVTSPGSPARRSAAPSSFRLRACCVEAVRAVLLISPMQALRGPNTRSMPLRSHSLTRGSGGPPSSARGNGGQRIKERWKAGIGNLRRWRIGGCEGLGISTFRLLQKQLFGERQSRALRHPGGYASRDPIKASLLDGLDII